LRCGAPGEWKDWIIGISKGISKRVLIYFTLLAVFSAWLIISEIRWGQGYVRTYVTDVYGPGGPENPTAFYAINTTITVCLQLGTALMFFLAKRFSRTDTMERAELLFLHSQVIFFTVLGCDDRFMLHEGIGLWLGISDALVLALWGVLELAVLFMFGRVYMRTRKVRHLLTVAAILYGVMVLIDGWAPEHMIARLAVEDLLKTWACVLLFMFGLEELTLKVKGQSPFDKSLPE